MTSWTLIILVIHFGSIQMPGFGTQQGCNAAQLSITREFEHQLSGSGAADLILATCVKVTK